MPSWSTPSAMVNLDNILSHACPGKQHKDGFADYVVETHCVRFTFTARPTDTIMDASGEYDHSLFEIKAVKIESY